MSRNNQCSPLNVIDIRDLTDTFISKPVNNGLVVHDFVENRHFVVSRSGRLFGDIDGSLDAHAKAMTAGDMNFLKITQSSIPFDWEKALYELRTNGPDST